MCVQYWRELYPTVTGCITVCLQYWRELYHLSYWIHHCVSTVLKGAVPPQLLDPSLCVYSSGRSCTVYPTVAGSITVCLQYWRELYPTVTGSITVCLQYWRELYPTVTGSITVCTVLEGAVPHSYWIHHCVYSVGGSCTPQLLDPSLCV